MANRVTIADVATAARVSITTVSHALNGKGRLTNETRERVREVAERLGYQPSALARGLAGGRSGILALTVASIDEFALTVGDFDYFMQLMSGATQAAFERGYSLTLVPSDSLESVLQRLPLDGAIVIDPVSDDTTIEQLVERDVPLVTTGRQHNDPPGTYWVDNDQRAGTRAMIDHLISHGATRIAMLTTPPLPSYTTDALEAFETARAELGFEGIVAPVVESASEGDAYATASKLLESDNPPDAIYGVLDRLALGALLAAEAAGIKVPDELLVAGCTDSRAAQSSRPSLTALSLNPEQIGGEAVDLLTTIIEKGPAEQPHRIVPFAVIPRASTEATIRANRA